ncbi:GNAT family N-acetyltransferase [Endozoicomonadaceae bacterium StTr2]
MTSNNTNPDINFSQVTGDQLGLVNRFYTANGHKGKCHREDQVFIARDKQQIIAAVRFTQKGKVWLLRGLWVALTRRRQGIGQALLQYCMPRFDTPVWCYPYDHLIMFYHNAGFLEQTDKQAPEVIAAPWRNYHQSGKTYALMCHQK